MEIHTKNSGPVCVRQLAAAMAANEKKLFIIHDESHNTSLAKLQTTSLITVMNAMGVTAYYRNGPLAAMGDSVEGYRRSWLGDGKADLNKSASFIRMTCDRKGPFYGMLFLGRTTRLGTLVAKEHGVTTEPSDQPDTGDYEVYLLTLDGAVTLRVPAPTNLDSEIPLPIPIIAAHVEKAVSNKRKLYNFPKPTMSELKEAKRARKQAHGKEEIATVEECYRRILNGSSSWYPYSASQRDKNKDSDAPVSNYISEPAAEPVTACSLESLAPMIEWLETKGEVREPRVDFTKGSILGRTTVGGGVSVDLCKQVVGPTGIGPIMDAIASNGGGIDRFLLGNNIVGDDGARRIADFMLRPEARNVYCFYIAGNSISSAGIQPIARSLAHNTNITALWLKRNPLGVEGAEHLARMLETNTCLQVLDLVGTNIQDAGAACIFEALARNTNSALEHLYLGSSNHGIPTAVAAAAYLGRGDSKLKSLFMSMSRLGDEGAIQLAEGLKRATMLERLGLSSCNIGVDGVKAIADAMEGKPNMVFLDLGWRRGTLELGESGNHFGDEGALYLGSKLMGPNGSLVSVDLGHVGMTHDGVQRLVESYVKGNDRIRAVRIKQDLGPGPLRRNLGAEKLVKIVCQENQARAEGNTGAAEIRVKEAMMPTHVKHIYSVYRGNM